MMVFGGGIKFLKVIILVYFLGLTIIEASAIIIATGFISLFISLSIILSQQFINFYFALSLALGMTIGGWFGTDLIIKKGERFAKICISILTIILSLTLLS